MNPGDPGLRMNSIAILHDWYTTFAGSEKVIQQLLQLYPQADLFSLVDFMPQQERAFLSGKHVTTTFLQRMPFARKHFRTYLPLMPLAVEQLDLSGYDLVFSNCHAVVKGVITAPDQLHISYIHSPIRYAWEMEKVYLAGGGLKNTLARWVMHSIRLWDYAAAQRPDLLLSNSHFIASRVQKYYRRTSNVLYPPVDTDFFTLGGERGAYYLAASRFVPYKRMDLIIQAFRSMPDKKLVLVGDGPQAAALCQNLPGNIRWLGRLPAEALRTHLRTCRAFVFAAQEDFGILPVEAQACGAPVIAFGRGGALETVRGLETPIGSETPHDPASNRRSETPLGLQPPHSSAAGHSFETRQPSGLFFPQQTAEAIQTAIGDFERNHDLFQPENCRLNALRFSNQRFRQETAAIVEQALQEFPHRNQAQPV